MAWPILIYCIVIFVHRPNKYLWTSGFRPVCLLSRSPAPRHGGEALLLFGVERLHRNPHARFSFTLMHLSPTDETEGNYRNKLLQKLTEPFDRWRFLQKLLDDDINDADEILFVLQASVQQRYLQQQSLLSRMTPIPQSKNVTTSMVSTVDTLKDTPAKLALDIDYLEDLDESLVTMNFIVQEKSSATLNELLLSVESSSASNSVSDREVFRFLGLLERLLPDPLRDEDAFKGLWDTVIELHGRESVRINEQLNTLNWRTRCLIARALIFFDFLSVGIPPHTDNS